MGPFLLTMLLVAGALLGVYVGKFPRWVHAVLVAALIIVAILIIRGEYNRV